MTNIGILVRTIQSSTLVGPPSLRGLFGALVVFVTIGSIARLPGHTIDSSPSPQNINDSTRFIWGPTNFQILNPPYP